MKKILLLIGAVAINTSCSSTRAPSAAESTDSSDNTEESRFKKYDEVITDEAISEEGLFTVHRIREKLFFEIPSDRLEEELLLVSRIARTPNGLGFGGQKVNTQVVRWQRHLDDVLLRVVSYENVADPKLPIFRAVLNSNFEPIVRAFTIEALSPDSSNVVIDVTDLFVQDVPSLGLQKSRRERYKVKSLDKERTFVTSAHSYPKNIEVKNVLTYEAAEPPSNGSTGAISLEMNHSMIALPAVPMKPRLHDERVGYFSIAQTDYGSDEQRAKERQYISRWRLEPVDTLAFQRGELVEPVKPIIYYLDPATPIQWRPYIKQGIEDWNVAFEAAGFRNAIRAKDPPTPEEDPEFSAEDIRYSVFRYFSSPVANAYGPFVVDPRSGEILESDIGWHHNVLNLLRNWYFVQTAAANPEARRVKFDDDVMGQLVRIVAAHEVGHTLGLPHNMKASASYAVDSLRSPTFTQKFGVAPSIMDYARFNYVAQPGDHGVSFLPKVGPYDLYSVRWGYRPILEAETPTDEAPTLNTWIREVENDPMYRFGNPSTWDPSSLTEALGDDAVKASRYGISNLRVIVNSLVTWTAQEGDNFDELKEIFGWVIDQWSRYMGHVMTIVGGIDKTPKTYDQSGNVYNFIERERQEQAMQFLADEALFTPRWMLREEILANTGHAPAVELIRKAQAGVIDRLFDVARLQRLIETEARVGPLAFGIPDFMADVHDACWGELETDDPIDVFRRNLQRAYIERLEHIMTSEQTRRQAYYPEYETEVDVSQSDIRAHVRAQLESIRGAAEEAGRHSRDPVTAIHLRDVVARIDAILEADE